MHADCGAASVVSVKFVEMEVGRYLPPVLPLADLSLPEVVECFVGLPSGFKLS
jgi:hypothetical protein